MGEYADMAIDESIDSWWEYDEDEPYDGWLGRPMRKRRKACKYCGRTPLSWIFLEKGWRLCDADGAPHTCSEYKKETPNASDLYPPGEAGS